MVETGRIERGPEQLGLTGMRERVIAMAGSLSIRHCRNGTGLALVAWVPCKDLMRSQHLDASE